MRRYGRTAQIGLSVVSFCAALVLAEVAVRLFFPNSRDHVLPGKLFAMDEDLGWALEPNRKVVHRSRYFHVVYRTNERGFRDRHRDGETDVRRVLLLGDSQVFGWGVSEADRFSNRIERAVPSLEVWNLGVPGYGLDQQVLAYERQGEGLVAETVVFFVSEPTLYRIHHDYLYGMPKPVFERGSDGALRPRRPRGVRRTRMLYALFGSLYLPSFVERRIAQWRNRREQEARSNRALEERGSPVAPRDIGDLERSLLLLARDIAARRRHEMLVLTALDPRRAPDLGGLCRTRDIRCVVLPFSDTSGEMVFGSGDLHWTPETHQRVARHLLPALNGSREPSSADVRLCTGPRSAVNPTLC